MKNITLFLILIPFWATTQETKTQHNNFKLQDDKTIVWQKIYAMKGNENQVIDSLKTFLFSQSFTTQLKLTEGKFIGRSNKTKVKNLKGINVVQDFDVFVIIDIKPNAYRVTINDVRFEPTNVGAYSGGIILSSEVSPTLSTMVIRNNHHEIRSNKSARLLLTRLDEDFKKYFEVTIQKKDDW